MSDKPALDPAQLAWKFGILHEDLPGYCVDQLIRNLLEVHSSNWIAAGQIWTASSQASKFSPEQRDLMVRLALIDASKRVGN